MRFWNRAAAGKLLGAALEKFKGQPLVVYGLPRGGVVTAYQVALSLQAPLDLIICRKIGHPLQPEYAIAAITETGELVGNQQELSRVDADWLETEKIAQQKEAKRRRELYLAGRLQPTIKGKSAIVVDDGVATGYTIEAAIVALRHQFPKKIVVAVPVVTKQVAERLKQVADEVIALETPEDFEFLGAVGAYYQDFSQTEDSEVLEIMKAFCADKKRL
jgi:predicted phosphoribosyltransferase